MLCLIKIDSFSGVFKISNNYINDYNKLYTK